MNMQQLVNLYHSTLEETPEKFTRFLADKIDWDDRCLSIYGGRGVGKTTLFLQHILQSQEVESSLFVMADNVYFSANTLVDLAYKFYIQGGQTLYIDEVHRYPGNWSQEIKNIYDSFPRLKIRFTGSSILDLENGGGGDLSRRRLKYYLPGLSFREYVTLKTGHEVAVVTLEDIIERRVQWPFEEMRPLPLFKEYLRMGYYPFFTMSSYEERLANIISDTLTQDIPRFTPITLSTVNKLKRLLYIISQNVPFKPNFTELAEDIKISRNDLSEIFSWMEKSALIAQLRDKTEALGLLGKVDKVYFNNTNMAYVTSDTEPEIGNIRETFFFSATRVGHKVVSGRAKGDFVVDGLRFEVGGKGKTTKQIAHEENAWVVADDIEHGQWRTLPLWQFGLLY